MAPSGRQAPLDRQLRLLEQAVGHDLHSPDEIRAALVPDQQGIGSGPDVASCDGVFPGEPQALDFG